MCPYDEEDSAFCLISMNAISVNHPNNTYQHYRNTVNSRQIDHHKTHTQAHTPVMVHWCMKISRVARGETNAQMTETNR